jgi:hypothetical protein
MEKGMVAPVLQKWQASIAGRLHFQINTTDHWPQDEFGIDKIDLK